MKKLVFIALLFSTTCIPNTIHLSNDVSETIIWEFKLSAKQKNFEEKTTAPTEKSSIKKPRKTDGNACQLTVPFKDSPAHCVFNIPEKQFVTIISLTFSITDLGRPRLIVRTNDHTMLELSADEVAMQFKYVPALERMAKEREEERAAEEKKRKNSDHDISPRGTSTTRRDSDNSSRYSVSDQSESQ